MSISFMIHRTKRGNRAPVLKLGPRKVFVSLRGCRIGIRADTKWTCQVPGASLDVGRALYSSLRFRFHVSLAECKGFSVGPSAVQAMCADPYDPYATLRCPKEILCSPGMGP